jgi:hypothetical protein
MAEPLRVGRIGTFATSHVCKSTCFDLEPTVSFHVSKNERDF